MPYSNLVLKVCYSNSIENIKTNFFKVSTFTDSLYFHKSKILCIITNVTLDFTNYINVSQELYTRNTFLLYSFLYPKNII